MPVTDSHAPVEVRLKKADFMPSAMKVVTLQVSAIVVRVVTMVLHAVLLPIILVKQLVFGKGSKAKKDEDNDNNGGNAPWRFMENEDSCTSASGGMVTSTVSYGGDWAAEVSCIGRASSLALIMIPGNPGAVDFYDDYLEEVYRLSGGRVQCLCFGHSGHSTASYTDRPHNLSEQIAHKTELVRRFIKDNPQARIVLAGHSVGAYMCLELMRDAFIQQHVARVLCLFPTIHHIGSTPNGRRLYPLLKHFRTAVAGLVHLISHLPLSVQRAVARWHIREGVSEKMLAAALKNIEPRVVYSCMLMGAHEMEEILHMDQAFLRSIDDRLVWYFGATDGWVTMDHAADVQVVCTRSDVHYCNEGISHAFVLGASKSMADKTWAWIQRHLGAASAAADASDPDTLRRRPIKAGGMQ